jgi:uncharacterized protein YndB with AHSA1/START domain
VIRVERGIEAAADIVWARLVELERWPAWTASINSLTRQDTGPLRIGSQARIKQPGFPAMTWTVTAIEPGRSFTWEASAPGTTTTATHEVRPDGRDAVLVLTLDHRGPARWLVKALTGGRTRRFLQLEAHGLAKVSTTGH